MSSPAIDLSQTWRGTGRRSTEQWEREGAARAKVRQLLSSLPTGFVVFHDLPLPKPSRARVDHLVVGPRNVWAVTTLVLAEPVTVGQGRNADTLFTGRTPLRTELEAADLESSSVAGLIGANVEPVVCVIAPGLPERSFDFHGIRICEPGSLARQVTASTADFVNVDRITAAVADAFGVHPDPGTSAPRLGVPTLPPGHRAHSTTRRGGTFGARIRSIRSRPLAQTGFLVAVVAALFAFFPAVVAIWNSIASEGAERISEVIEEAPVDGATSSATEPPPPVVAAVTCAAPGAGWSIEWAWPGELADGVVGYGVRTQVGDEPPVVHTLVPWSDPAAGPPPARLRSSDVTTILTDHRGPDGRVIATTSTSVSAPTDAC